jgi:hypothetical protein
VSEPKDGLNRLLAFIAELDRRSIHYSIASHRSMALMVEIDLPGEKWEVEFMDGGGLEIERFRSDGQIADETALADLWAATND